MHANVIELDADPNRQKAEEQRLAQLSAFAGGLVAKRKEAVEARRLSGIEQQWLEDEEYYNGVDDYNRGAYMLKPATKVGRVTEAKKADSTKSTAFLNITQPYVDVVSAREFDMLFPVDDKPFAFEPTPVPDIEAVVDSTEPMPIGGVTEGDAAKAFLAEAEAKAEAAETQVWDWLAESNWHTEGRKVIQQKNKIGTGVLKGPFPFVRERSRLGQDDLGNIIAVKSLKRQPASKMIDAWNLYPDPACGNDIHNGSYIWEKDNISGKQLRALKRQPGYIAAEIDQALKEGPDKKYLADDDARRQYNTWYQDQDTFKIWYFHGYAEAKDLEAANCPCNGEGMDVCVILVNDRVIKASQSVLDSGEFPYDVFVYQERQDYWAGIGVARQVRTPQDICNAAMRAMLDNSGISAGPQIIFRSGIVSPADGNMEITPHKIWYVDEDATLQDVRDAFMSVVIPNNQQHMEAVIRLALEMAERITSMPLLLQGQQGAATETVGGMQILQQNSNTVLRRCAKLFDDVVERHITRYYQWLLQYGEDDNAKGDFNIVVKGSSALYERDAQNQMILQLVEFAADPGFALSKERLMVEILKSNKVSPDRVMLTDEEKKQLAQQPPPEDPAIQVAKLKIEGEMQKEQLRQQNDDKDAALKQDELESGFALKLQLHEKDADLKRELAGIQRDLKIMEIAQQTNMSISGIKAQLADSAMKIQADKELFYAGKDSQSVEDDKQRQHERDQNGIEPPGRAPDGEAYAR